MNKMQTKKDDFIGKTVMNKEGLVIGKIKDIQIASDVNEIKTISVESSEDINSQAFTVNEQGDIVIPFQDLTRVKNIFVFEVPSHIIKKVVTLQ
jgi:sporulation protein YlmC with PRC-barrel domain